jgi:hypothetical protein
MMRATRRSTFRKSSIVDLRGSAPAGVASASPRSGPFPGAAAGSWRLLSTMACTVLGSIRVSSASKAQLVIQQQFAGSLPGQGAAQVGGGALRHARQHRLQVDHQHAEAVDAHGAHLLHRGGLRRILCHHPGLVPVDVLVGAVRQFHDTADCLAEFPVLVAGGDVLARPREVREQFGLGTVRGQAVAVLLAQEAGAAAGDVNDLADDIAFTRCTKSSRLRSMSSTPSPSFAAK